MIDAASECELAVYVAEDFLQLKRNTLKYWLRDRL